LKIDDIDDNNDCYLTTDTALAAWLYTQGFELVDIKTESFPSVFYFENSNSKLTESVRIFQRGEAEGNILTFFRAYRRLVGMIKTRKWHA